MRTGKAAPPVAALTAALLLGGCVSEPEPAAGESSSSPSTASSPSETAEPGEPSASSEPPESSTSPEPSGPSAEETAEPKGVVVEIEIEEDEISPNGARIEVEIGEPVILELESDRAGELHVHSTPEQVVEFGPGTTQRELVIEQPGVVEVEEHESGFVVLQLQVS